MIRTVILLWLVIMYCYTLAQTKGNKDCDIPNVYWFVFDTTNCKKSDKVVNDLKSTVYFDTIHSTRFEQHTEENDWSLRYESDSSGPNILVSREKNSMISIGFSPETQRVQKYIAVSGCTYREINYDVNGLIHDSFYCEYDNGKKCYGKAYKKGYVSVEIIYLPIQFSKVENPKWLAYDYQTLKVVPVREIYYDKNGNVYKEKTFELESLYIRKPKN